MELLVNVIVQGEHMQNSPSSATLFTRTFFEEKEEKRRLLAREKEIKVGRAVERNSPPGTLKPPDRPGECAPESKSAQVIHGYNFAQAWTGLNGGQRPTIRRSLQVKDVFHRVRIEEPTLRTTAGSQLGFQAAT